MFKRIWLSFLVLVYLAATSGGNVYAASTDVYVSPSGNDSNACTSAAPCRTIQKGVNTVNPGGTLYILPGTYSESISFSRQGTQSQPIRIVGQQAVLSNGGQLAFSVSNSQWVTFEGLTIKGYSLSLFEIRQSHYLTFRNNIFDYTFAAVRIKDGVSHVLVENNEIYQSYPAGSTWSSLKGSKYEGGGVYASTGGYGMYVIRGNYFHDSMNGVYISDNDAGPWMNANVFISNNIFKNLVDDPYEPEGDSFNHHFFNNLLINTHRMASIVPHSACVGPIFVYGNYQQNNIDPTGEAASGRRNSVIKLDTSNGACPNGVWVFNNTANANAAGTNFYAVDLLSSNVRNYQMFNNVLVTEKNVYSGNPSFTNAASAFNISLKPFGYNEANSWQADPLLASDGTLQANSPARGRGTAINIANYFVSSSVVPNGADLGGFRNFPAPKYVTPPGGAPSGFPATAAGWPDLPANAPQSPLPPSPAPSATPQSSGPFVSTVIDPASLNIGGSALVSVNLNNVPAEGYKSAEFTCTYDAGLVGKSNIVATNLFGADAVVAVHDPQNGSFIVAVAGADSNRATTNGPAFTFDAKGLQAGQTQIQCTARVSKGDNVPIDLPSTAAALTILGVDSSPTSSVPPTATPGDHEHPTATSMPVESPTSEPTLSPTSTPSPNGSLSGQVIASKPVTVSLLDAGNVVVTSVVANPDGTFLLTPLAGNYTLAATASGFLSHQGAVTVSGGSTTVLPAVSLLAGDVDGNNVIDQFDALTIGMSYTASTPESADLNNDGVIDFLDLELLAENYRKTGPTNWD